MLARTWLARLLVAIGLAALIVLYLFPLAVEQRIPADRDNLCFYFPLLTVFQWDGFPTWNPYELAGSSLAANPQTALFYPPNWILPFVPWAVGFCLTAVLHYLWGGLGAFLLGRRFKLGRPAAFFVALTFMLGAYLQCRILNRPLLLSAAWMPWSLALFIGALETGRLLPAVLAGAATAMTFLPGMYHNGLYTLFCLGVACLLVPLPRKTPFLRAALRRAGLIALTALIALGLSAPSLLPALELIPSTIRSRFDYASAGSSSVAVSDLPHALLGLPRKSGVAEWNFFEKNAFPGWVALPLALLAFIRLLPRKTILPRGARRAVALLALVFAAGLLLALGSHAPFHRFLFELPGGRFFNNPSRALVLCSLALSLLAGIGLEECDQLLCRWRRARCLGVGAILFLQTASLFFYRGVLHVVYTQPPFGRDVPHLDFLERSREEGQRIMTYDALKTVSGDFWPHHWPRYRHMLTPKLATIARFEDIAGYEPLYLTRYGDVVRALAGDAPGGLLWRDLVPGEPDPRLLDLLSVGYVLGEPHDRLVHAEKMELVGPSEGSFEVDPEIGPCVGIRIQAALGRSLRLPQGTKVATLWVRGRDQNRERVAESFPIRAGLEVTDMLAASDPGCDHRTIDVYRRWSVDGELGPLVVQSYEARIPFPRPITPERIQLRHFSPEGDLIVWSVVLERAPKRSPFERVYTQEPYRVYRNRGALPRARILFRAETVPGPDQALARLRDPDWDPRETVILEQVALADTTPGATGEVTWTSRGRESAELDVNLSHPGALVLAEVFYPGWKAWLDGDRVPIIPANGFLRAVLLPQGRHHLRFTYAPDGLFLGLWVAAATIGATIVMLLVSWWSRQKELATLSSTGGPTMEIEKRVLIVEDEADTRLVLLEGLQYYGYLVTAAKDGMEALQALEKKRPDVILMDMNLPVLSGWEAVQMIKADQRLTDIPIIAMTTIKTAAEEARALNLGCADYIPKPCEPKDVAARIERVLERRRRI